MAQQQQAPLPAIPHQLSLKVLRLQSPSLHHDSSLPYSPPSISASLPISDLLVLPTSFGGVHLGEKFTALIVAANDSDDLVYTPSLRVEMVTATAKLLLAEEQTDGPKESKPGESIQARIDLEIRELGQHALACTVAYGPRTNASDQPSIRSFRKTYKFQTSNPLSVKTKILPSRSPLVTFSEHERETSYLEVQIQNAAKSIFSFSKIVFDPSPGFTHTDCNPFPDYLDFLYPGDIRQMLYIVKPEITPSKLMMSAQKSGALALGRLDIEWRGPTGTTGRLQTSNLMRKMAPMPQPVSSSDSQSLSWELFVVEQPQSVAPGDAFTLKFKLQVSEQAIQDPSIPSILRLQVQHLSIPAKVDIQQNLASALSPPSRTSELLARSMSASPRASLEHLPNLSKSTLQPSPHLTCLGLGMINLPPVRRKEDPKRMNRLSVMSNETDGGASLESNTPLSVLVERAASRSQSQASAREEDYTAIDEGEEEDIGEIPESTTFELHYVADKPGLCNIGVIRVGLLGSEGQLSHIVDYPVVAQVYVE